MPKNEYSCDCNIIHQEVVDKIKDIMPEDDILNRAATFLKILGDGTRFRIIWALNQHEMCVCDLANLLNMTKSAVSHQLSTLRIANLVKYRKEGKTVYYSLADDHVELMMKASLSHVYE